MTEISKDFAVRAADRICIFIGDAHMPPVSRRELEHIIREEHAKEPPNCNCPKCGEWLNVTMREATLAHCNGCKTIFDPMKRRPDAGGADD